MWNGMRKSPRRLIAMSERTRVNSRLRWAGLWLGLIIGATVYAAEVSHTLVQETSTPASSSDTPVLSSSELAHARIWGLSKIEWRRYKELMQGIRGSVSPSTISPIEVLGIHARDQEERRRYAEQWAQAMREDVERILAFQYAYDEAGKRLYPNEQLIDVARLPQRAKKTSVLQAGDRVLFFTRPDCPACDGMLARLLKRINEINGIDIYLAGIAPGNDQAVRGWASNHAIRPEWVIKRQVTLNHEAGALDKLTQGQGEMPYLMIRRGEALSVLSASDL